MNRRYIVYMLLFSIVLPIVPMDRQRVGLFVAGVFCVAASVWAHYYIAYQNEKNSGNRLMSK